MFSLLGDNYINPGYRHGETCRNTGLFQGKNGKFWLLKWRTHDLCKTFSGLWFFCAQCESLYIEICLFKTQDSIYIIKKHKSFLHSLPHQKKLQFENALYKVDHSSLRNPGVPSGKNYIYSVRSQIHIVHYGGSKSVHNSTNSSLPYFPIQSSLMSREVFPQLPLSASWTTSWSFVAESLHAADKHTFHCDP